MAKSNFIDDAVDNVSKRLIHMAEEADKVEVVPVGMEPATPEQQRQRFRDDPKYRADMVNAGKSDELLNLFKGQS
jgi:hypothetical protein